MGKKIIIVESPAKAKTIEGYLGAEYKVVSSVGHIRDLAKSGPGALGIDIENNFKPKYTYIKGKKKIVKDIYKLTLGASEVLIATDPDREGEAIGWHLMDELELDLNEKNRIVFSEITKNGVLTGIANKRLLDTNLVSSQEARRFIDRIMGFKLSRLLQSKIKEKSAGRVQSVALYMIVNREKEIIAFTPVQYFELYARVDSLLIEYKDNNKKLCSDDIRPIFERLVENNSNLFVESIKETIKSSKPSAGYTTASFQRDAINKLSMTSKSTMRTAQKLYEGIEIDDELQGLITYMRTDSTRFSKEFVRASFDYIEKEYGKNYLGTYLNKKNNANAQDGHEAIRPTDITKTPMSVKKYLTTQEYNIYKLIWTRALSSLMTDSKSLTKTCNFVSNDGHKFKTSITNLIFDGYKILSDLDVEVKNFDFLINQEIKVSEFILNELYTKPPARYTESRLIKELEENGVGRPSTYSSIIDVLKTRGYVNFESKSFTPTESGILVSDNLQQYFSKLISIDYTSTLENELDQIASGDISQLEVLEDFYTKFMDEFDNASDKMNKIEDEFTGNICPECDSALVMRKGRYGPFEACSNFPKCRYITETKREKIIDCPDCGGDIVEKITKKKKVFYACNNYPGCKFAVWNLSDLGIGEIDE